MTRLGYERLGAHGGDWVRPSAPDDAVLDQTARVAYQQRLRYLDDELDAADRAGDADRAARAQAERDAVVAELRRATGLSGRRRSHSNEAERAGQRHPRPVGGSVPGGVGRAAGRRAPAGLAAQRPLLPLPARSRWSCALAVTPVTNKLFPSRLRLPGKHQSERQHAHALRGPSSR